MGMIVVLQSMNHKHAVDAGIGQRQSAKIHQRRGGRGIGRPVHHALFGGHKGKRAYSIGAQWLQIGNGVANPQNRIPRTRGPQLAYGALKQPLRHLPERRAIKSSQVNHVNGHALL